MFTTRFQVAKLAGRACALPSPAGSLPLVHSSCTAEATEQPLGAAIKEGLEKVYAAVSGSKVEQPSSTPVPGSPSGAPNSNADSLVESGKDYSGVQQAGTSLHGDAPGPTGPESTFAQHVLKDAVRAADDEDPK